MKVHFECCTNSDHILVMTGCPLTMSLVILMTKSAQEMKRISRQELSDEYWKISAIVEAIKVVKIVTLLLLNQLEVRLWFFLVLNVKK